MLLSTAEVNISWQVSFVGDVINVPSIHYPFLLRIAEALSRFEYSARRGDSQSSSS